MSELTKKDYEKMFGFDPETIGLRHRGYWVVDSIEYEEYMAGASIGNLCVEARDGGFNAVDSEAFKQPNYVGTSQDTFDVTYRYYYYKELGQ